MEISGNISNAAGPGDTAIVNWSAPENETKVDHYDMMLIGSHTNSNILVFSNTQVQIFSYTFGVAEVNYSAVSVTAVDVCGQ